MSIKENGLYIITGGLGGIGIIIAEALMNKYKVNVALLGRSALNEDKRNKLNKLKTKTGSVEYYQCDISDERQVNEVFDKITLKYKNIDGIFHCAGVIRDSFIVNKKKEDIEEVFKPKIKGTLFIIKSAIKYKIDFAVLFSSISILGSSGQCDYAFANNFMDKYCALAKDNGITSLFSISWPLWKDGGMKITKEYEEEIASKSGVSLLDNTLGVQALNEIMNSGNNNTILFNGSKKKILKLISNLNKVNIIKDKNKGKFNEHNKADVLKDAEKYFIDIFSEVTGIKKDRIYIKETLDNYGVDSIVIMNMNKALEDRFGSDISKTLFFEYQTLADITNYFVENYYDKVLELLGKTSIELEEESVEEFEDIEEVIKEEPVKLNNRFISNNVQKAEKIERRSNNDMAIIGVAGRYPMADNVEEYWNNLLDGKDCITEIPSTRWDYKKYFSKDKNAINKTYSKWGGFINDVDKFDPLFFNISPKEALITDPQERLFLENAWNTIEDSGYSKSSLSGKKIGVFVGVMYGNYQLNGTSSKMQEIGFTPSSSYSSIANRVSYFFNFHGPSMAIDTMCSSSLVSVHLACESILNGECEMAIAGGVNLMTHPNKYLQLSQGKFLATDGRCHSFGENGDGYVPGEGVGSILIKPLDKAIEDNDYIYGVIKGSAVNHGGKTNGYSVPNPNAQSDVIEKALERSNINPKKISYVEAHGTGTELGDPIEIQGLTKVYKKYTDDKQYCYIGSVKSNIGHLESAAGIAAITKVIMQFKNNKIVPTINCDKLNTNINFKDTPFKVIREVRQWDSDESKIAAISAFGAGGTNCHIILESFNNKAYTEKKAENIIILSAKSDEDLKEYAINLKEALSNKLKKHPIEVKATLDEVKNHIKIILSEIAKIESNQLQDYDLIEEYDLDIVSIENFINKIKEKYKLEIPLNKLINITIDELAEFIVNNSSSNVYENTELNDNVDFTLEELAYTMQTGKERFNNRLAIITNSFDDLIEKLDKYISDENIGQNIYCGSFEKNKSSNVIYDSEEGQIFLKSLISKNEYENIALLWINGVEFDWKLLYKEIPKKCSIATYPFKKESYWIPDVDIQENISLSENIQENVSNLENTIFRSVFAKKDLLLENNVTFEDNILLDLMMINLGIESANLVENKEYNTINNIIFGPQVKLDDKIEVYTRLYKNGNNIEYETIHNGEVCIQGNIGYIKHKNINLSKENCETFKFNTSKNNICDIFAKLINSLELFLKEKLQGHYSLNMIKEAVFNSCDFSSIKINICNFNNSQNQVKLDISVVTEDNNVILELKEVNLAKIETSEDSVKDEILDKKINLDTMIKNDLNKIICDLLQMPSEKIDDNLNFAEYGFDSIMFKEMAEKIKELYNIDFSVVSLFDNGTAIKLTKYLKSNYIDSINKKYDHNIVHKKNNYKSDFTYMREKLKPLENIHKNNKDKNSNCDIAVVGISGIFPKSHDLSEFWNNIKDEKDLISEIPKERWDWREFSKGDISTSSKYGGFIPDVDKFDAGFFNISPMEAEMMDPQQRLFLQTTWKVIEDGGYKISDLSGEKVGIFVGVQFSDYQKLLSDQGILNPLMGLGNEHCILANRISYMFNFRGPSEVYNTACSSSLVAIHRAINSIRTGESKIAIAGGVSLMLSPYTMISADQMGILSSDGKCKTLDENGDGYVKGEGVGAVLLMPLEEAIKENHYIYGVIKSSSVNHGGKSTSLTAPNTTAEKELIVDAMRKADISPNEISYLELHGTGTQLGDPIEIEAIKQAFSEYSNEIGVNLNKNYCGIGSVKTNIGHLEPAAGIAGVLKVILSLKYKKIPGMLNLKELNKYISLTDTPFYIAKETQKWEKLKNSDGTEVPRIAGVSSFGFGGVNAHVIIQEYDNEIKEDENIEPQIIVISAKSKDSIKQYAIKLHDYIKDNHVPLEDIAYVLQMHREPMKYRMSFIADNLIDLEEQLNKFLMNDAEDKIHEAQNKVLNKEEYDLYKLITDKKYSDIAALWNKGVNVDFTEIWNGKSKIRVPIPSYQFKKTSYWAVKNTPKKIDMKDTEEVKKYKGAKIEDIIKIINDILFNILKIEEIDKDVELSEYGLDSILSTTISKKLESKLNIVIPINEINTNNTVSKLANYIYDQIKDKDIEILEVNTDSKVKAHLDENISEEVIVLNSSGTKQPSFWVHGGPGYGTYFAGLSQKLGSDYPFYAFQAKGVDGIKMPRDFEEMVEKYIECIKAIKPEGPYIIGGYSSGGMIAYEMARRMHSSGEKIESLIMLDTLPATEEALEKIRIWHSSNKDFIILMMANEIAKSREQNKNIITMDDLNEVSDIRKVAHVAKLIKQRTNIRLSEDEIYNYINGSMRLNDYVEDFYEKYSLERYSASKITYFKAEKGFISESSWMGYEVEDVYKGYSYTDYWSEMAENNISVVNVPSDHFNILEGESLNIVSNKLEQIIKGEI